MMTTAEDGNLSARPLSDEAVIAALRATLAPYPWRRLTPERLVRFALAARDQQNLAGVLSEVPGAGVGTWERLEPAERSDARVPRVVELLDDLRRADVSLLTMCRNLILSLAPS